MADSKVDKLHKAGLVNSEELEDHQKKAIEDLSDDEVESLIQIKQKLGFDGTLPTDSSAKVL